MRELLLDNRLRLASGFDEEGDFRLPSNMTLPQASHYSGNPVARGQIRLLSQPSFMTYVAVLDRWDEESFLIAPFSRFGQPATDEELKTEYDGGAFMRVLQLWNARSAMTATLRKSWLVGELPQQDVNDALLVWKWSIGDVAKLPERIAERTGVPIYRMDDPRLDYRREALENFAAFDAEDDANADLVGGADLVKASVADLRKHATKLRLWCRVAKESPMRATAASIPENSRQTFIVKGYPAKLRGEFSQTDKALVFSTWDKERREKTDILDGFGILLDGAEEPIPIKDKTARIPVSKSSAKFVLVDHDGKIIETREERGKDRFKDDDFPHIYGFGEPSPEPGSIPFDALSFQDDLAFPNAGLDAVFYPTSTLLAVLGDSGASSESRTLAVAELLVRHSFLKGTDEFARKELGSALGVHVLSRFDQAFRNYEDNADDVRPDDVLRTLRGIPGERLLCDRIRPVLNADGFIPLKLEEIEGRPACLLPFSFERCPSECKAGTVLEWSGKIYEDWTNLLQDRLHGVFERHGEQYCIRLAFVVADRFESLLIEGESLLLPVLVAWARFCGKLPRYDVFRLFATGEVSPGGELRRVETEAKWSLVRTLPGARLLAPDTGDLDSQDSSAVLAEGESVRDNLPASIVEKIEEWFVADWKYAVARLADQGLVSEINHGRYGGWERMIDRLEHLRAPLSGDDEKERLLTEMWLGQACCHAARTDAAMEHNRRAHRLAAKVRKYRYELQRLDVEMIVNLTDKEAFDEVAALSESLEKEIGGKGWSDKVQQADLSMRWHGSLGQALAYATLDGRPGFSKEAAKKSLKAALDEARRRKELHIGENPEADASEFDADIVQDANYIHLWHALFKPSSKAAVDSYVNAKRLRGRLEARSAARRTNEVYQLRQLALAAYRRLLSGKAADAIAEETFELESEAVFLGLIEDTDASPWIRATVAKYFGALKAALGDAEEARWLFKTAASLLSVASVMSIPGDDGKILRKIAMTVRAEAFRSLHSLFPNEAAGYCAEAMALLADIPDRDGRWRDWLEEPSAAPFPGLSYWY